VAAVVAGATQHQSQLTLLVAAALAVIARQLVSQ
jgi:hypothetical protein